MDPSDCILTFGRSFHERYRFPLPQEIANGPEPAVGIGGRYLDFYGRGFTEYFGMKSNDAMEKIRQEMAEREKGYRARALKLFPHVCGSCGREFSGAKLKELTVHHKDHNHQNNPPDGSNWELLCVYCHDHEHEKHKMKGFGSSDDRSVKRGGFSAFEGLDGLFGDQKGDENNA